MRVLMHNSQVGHVDNLKLVSGSYHTLANGPRSGAQNSGTVGAPKPRCAFRIPHVPAEGEGEAGGAGDSDGPVVFNVQGLQVPGAR